MIANTPSSALRTCSISSFLSAAAAVLALGWLTPCPASAQTRKLEVRSGGDQDRPAQYQNVNGWAVTEGDIILGRVEDIQRGSMRHGATPQPHAYSIAPTTSSLWPKVGNVYQVPYTNDNGNAVAEQAVVQFNATMSGVIQYIKRTNQPDYVQFTLDTNGCSSQSYVGRVGGAQAISGSASGDCVTVIMHEMGHSVGLYHEQSRTDGAGYVQIQWNNIDPANRSQFYGSAGALNLGLYDIGSAMHYSDTLFALDPTDVVISSVPVGIPFKDGGGYSAGDIDAIRRLYNAAPAQVTVTTVPPGLQVTVDDQPVTSGTSGATFSWTLASQHTLDVPANLQTQTLNGTTYVFGRWNDIGADQPVRHTINITPGDTTYLYPATSPKYTTYSASFRVLTPATGNGAITTGVSPAASGTVALSPDPMTVNGATYYYAFQPLTVQASPALGFNFYDWQFDGASPKLSGANARVVRPGLTQNVVARFAQNPVTTIATSPAGLPVTVDGNAVYATKNFAQDFDTAWTQGSSHSISVASPLPSNIADPQARLVFANWSDGGAQTHNITVGANATYMANFNTQVLLNATQAGVQLNNNNSNCAATFTTTPASADSYYNLGTGVSIQAQANAGWNFLGWQGDVTGTANPGLVTMNATRNVQAVLNVAPATNPLTVASILPAVGPLNGPAMTVTINGSGFNPNSQVCFVPPNGAGPCVQTTFQTTTQMQAQVTPDLLTTAQTFNVIVSNSPDGQCSVSASAQFPVQ